MFIYADLMKGQDLKAIIETAKSSSSSSTTTTATSIIDSDSNSNEPIVQQHDQQQSSSSSSWMTEAQKKFLAQQEKRQLARVMAKASKTHKQRVEEFNSHLENLSEHYDIPKVSWTK
ncbi:protein fam32a-like protein [Dermatophagoides farinae]|uniref:Protein fam32a-like protein n=1 Tax=Dermatophagoides farinae TaxID=6954 RepID=A0A9D4NL71_DERFA|nr:protein fam32a-like protein [Dermatophagoides farinae]